MRPLSRWHGILVFCGVLALACDDEPSTGSGATPPSPTSKATPGAATVGAKGSEEKPEGRPLAPDLPRSAVLELPVAEDFEREASESMALENLEAELDRLEAEIASLQN